MTFSARRACTGLAALSLLSLAACAQNPAEPVRGVFEMTKFATPPAKMPDFVVATRPDQPRDYMPVGVDAPARSLKPKAEPEALSTRKQLEDEAKRNNALTGTAAKP
jgi:hypothetical protein